MKVRVSGFSLIELLITVIIIAITAVIGTNSLTTVIANSRIEEAAQSVATNLSYARSAAILKGCPTRMIMCKNQNCAGVSTQGLSAQTSTSGNFIGTSTGPAQYYAVIRQTTPCASDAGQVTDGLANWDFDARPKKLPDGIVFAAIYNHGGIIKDSNADATVTNSLTYSDVTNSIWFDTDLTQYIPVSNNLTATGNSIAFQVQSSTCDPAVSSTCLAYFVTISDAGETSIKKCLSGARSSSGGDICFGQ